MNVFNKVTLQSLKKNQTRTIVTIIGIILSAAMICAVTTFTSSMQDYALKSAIYTEGAWHGSEINANYSVYEDIAASHKIESAVYMQQLGYAYVEGCTNEYKPYLYVLGGSQGTSDMLPVHITSGKYPAASNEILLPEHLASNGGVQYKVGDTLTLELGVRMLDGFPLNQKNLVYDVYEEGDKVLTEETLEVKESRTYTVVGFYERLSWKLEDYYAPGYTAITVADKESSAKYQYDIYFKMNNAKDVYDFMEENGYSGDRNTDVLMYQGTSQYHSFTAMLVGLAAIVISLIMFGSVSLIYNAFSISVSERTKQFGLLSSIGATKKQLRRMVFFETFTVALIGIPIGVVSGIAGIGITLMFLGNKFTSLGMPIEMELSVSPISVVIAVVVALVTVLISAWIPSKRVTKISVVEAIRQNSDIKTKNKAVKTWKLTYKLFGLPGMLASKHYKRSKKKYRATVVSLFMSIVLFVSASAFTDYLMESVTGGFKASGYDLSVYIGVEDFEDVTQDEFLSKVKNVKFVTDAAYTQAIYEEAEIGEEYLTKEGMEQVASAPSEITSAGLVPTYIVFVDDMTFKNLLEEQGLSQELYMDKNNPLAIALDGFTAFNYTKERFETVNFLKSDSTEYFISSGKLIEGYWCYGVIANEQGDTVVRYYENSVDNPDVGGAYIDLSPEDAYNTTTLKSGKTIYERPFFLNATAGVTLIYPTSLAKDVFPDWNSKYYSYQFLIKSSNHAESCTELKTLLAHSGLNEDNLHDKAELEESNRNMVLIIQVFSYGFILLISLIAAANVFNTISTNIGLRRREFAMLKSVGMTTSGFNKMMNFECLLYGSKALLWGLPVSCGITYLIYLSIMKGYETTFHLPWGAIGIAVLSVFLVVFATMMYAMSKIKKDNPIDALKNENL